MARLLWRMTRGYRLAPWRSPYLRWRIETFTGIHADDVTFGRFVAVCWRYRREFWRYLRWGARMAGAD